MGQIGPDITFDELRRDHIESLRVIDDLRTRAESLEKKLEEREREIDEMALAIKQACEAVRIQNPDTFTLRPDDLIISEFNYQKLKKVIDDHHFAELLAKHKAEGRAILDGEED